MASQASDLACEAPPMFCAAGQKDLIRPTVLEQTWVWMTDPERAASVEVAEAVAVCAPPRAKKVAKISRRTGSKGNAMEVATVGLRKVKQVSVQCELVVRLGRSLLMRGLMEVVKEYCWVALTLLDSRYPE
ncbi:hypothetical protein NDU88_004552 [Pleurodeles waltl]|uniref:Uncharacterized protein n=1 Tax=Pleurodeles waltl TaxID=8319 RepID=A0AAV7T8F4_PLEWA|nr:hypothetical protein NDU88_004552 [Pleurodeles waltl]